MVCQRERVSVTQKIVGRPTSVSTSGTGARGHPALVHRGPQTHPGSSEPEWRNASRPGFYFIESQGTSERERRAERSSWRALLGVEDDAVIEGVEYDQDAGRDGRSLSDQRGGRGQIAVAPAASGLPATTAGEGRRRWRCPDPGGGGCSFEADAPRGCGASGPRRGGGPAGALARHGAGTHTQLRPAGRLVGHRVLEGPRSPS